MKMVKALCIVLCITTLFVTFGSNVFTEFARADTSESKHWVYDELTDFKQNLYPVTGKDSIQKFILGEEYLDQPIKVNDWAILLNAVLRLPSESKDSLLRMYVYDLATEDEITREDAVGGMVKLLTIQYLSGSVTAEELMPAEALKDLHAISERQETLVRLAYSEGLVDSNTTVYFRPQERLTVAEAVSMLNKIILKFNISYDDALKDDIQESSQSKDISKNVYWLEAVINQYRNSLQINLKLLETVEYVLLDGSAVYEKEICNEAVSSEKWSEVLKLVLQIEDDMVLHSYTAGLVEGDKIPRGVAVAGMIKLLHYNGMIIGRDASAQERSEAANAFTDYNDAFDTSKLAIAYSEKLIAGYPGQSFRPKQNITKGEALILMIRIMEKFSDKYFGTQ